MRTTRARTPTGRAPVRTSPDRARSKGSATHRRIDHGGGGDPEHELEPGEELLDQVGLVPGRWPPGRRHAVCHAQLVTIEGVMTPMAPTPTGDHQRRRDRLPRQSSSVRSWRSISLLAIHQMGPGTHTAVAGSTTANHLRTVPESALCPSPVAGYPRGAQPAQAAQPLRGLLV